MTAPKAQQGMVTVVGAVFLIVVVLLMVEVALHMAGSDTTDSGLQNDSIDALFLAESGLQRTLWRFGQGTGCAALAPDGPISFGAGTFKTVSATTLANGLCRVQVSGTVNDALGKAQRTVQADLRAAQSGWAVGDGGTLLRWSNGSWRSVASGTTRNLNGVYCAAADDCWAVGDRVALHWNGSAWQATTFNNGIVFNKISCLPGNSNECYLAGQWYSWGLIARWQAPGNWAGVVVYGRDFTDINCDTGTCFATSQSGLVARGTGYAWYDDGSGTTTALNGIDCVAATGECWAVGNDVQNKGKDFTVDHRSGSWTPTSLNLFNKATPLRAVSCPASNDCWAVGDPITTGSPANRGEVMLHWDGANWARMGSYLSVPDVALHDVRCNSTTDCWAVGASGTAVHWDGTGWTAYPTGTTQTLNGVSFPGGGSGSAALVNWQEVVK